MAAAWSIAAQPRAPRRNVILFVADGLRHDAVNATDTPALWRIRTQGVHFANSHSLFPTFTTPNASAIATGHGLGDTGDYANNLWIGAQMFTSGNFGRMPGGPIVALENDQALADLNSRYRGSYLGAGTLMAAAREHGYNTAVLGKTGPAAIQDVEAITPVRGAFPALDADIIVDDTTGNAAGIPLPARLVARLRQERVPVEAPSRSNGFGATSQFNNGYGGDRTHPGTLMANVVQQQWFADVATRGVLPLFQDDRGKPFFLIFWSRDPDGSQHGQGDSLGKLTPGINGPTARDGVRNADRTLQRLLDWLDQHPAIKAATDVVVTSDHGFATVSRKEIDAAGHTTSSEAAQHEYRDGTDRVETETGTLPHGFLAMDLAVALHWNVFDPAQRAQGGTSLFRRLRMDRQVWEHPSGGHAFLGEEVRRADGSDAKAVVVADGVDLIYVPDGSAATVRQIVAQLATFDYVGGIFVDDRFGEVPGSLPMSAIRLEGEGQTPRPAVIVAFKVFYTNPSDLRTGVMIVDSSFQEGQGMHGGLGRECTFNNMAAIGPDFKARYVDAAPVGNGDLAPTLAHAMGFELPALGGPLMGRVMREALMGGPAALASPLQQVVSAPADGHRTLVHYREFGGKRYIEDGCFVGDGVTACR